MSTYTRTIVAEVSDQTDQLESGNTWTADVVTDRVSVLELPDTDIASIKVTGGLDYGHVSVNPDNTLAVVLTDTTSLEAQSFNIEITDSDGNVSEQTVGLSVSAGTQDAGWGIGDFYMLETDDQDNLVIEHGEHHRKVYVSGDEDALTKADIAAIENLEESDITGAWLEANPDYGGSEGMALASDAGSSLWGRITGIRAEDSSNWLLLERGYEYDNMSLVNRGTTGESELNPIYIGAYGEGTRPVINSAVNIAQEGSENVVIQGLEFSEKVTVMSSENIIFNDLSSSGGFNLQGLEALTLRNSSITDLHVEEPRGDDPDIWSPHVNRSTGIYLTQSESILFEGLYIDQVGWEDDYRTDLSTEGGQPPNIYSHNMYITNSNTDFTLRDTISTQGSGSAALVRAGGYVEDNVFIDSNAGVAINGGQNNEDGTREGNYTLYNGNVITSGAHRTVESGPQGGLTGGLDNRGADTTIIDSIVTHLANPDSPEEQAEKPVTHQSYSELLDTYYNDIITYNWDGSTNNNPDDDLERNVEGLDRDVLDETTIQRFTSELLGRDHDTNPATISDLTDFLTAQTVDGAANDTVDADVINDYFKSAFGIDTTLRADAETLRFVPSDLSDGVRWDNRLNWDSNDLPGTQDGDSVDLGGNWVLYGGTTTLENLSFGDNGKLDVGQGHLQIDNTVDVSDTGATLNIDAAGQFWSDGYTDPDLLTIDASGGRFANTGLFTGSTEMNVSDNAQVILASDNADFILNGNSSLNITGDDAKVGFDGDQGGTGVLLMDDAATLSFIAEDGGIGRIGEFYSGAYDAEGDGGQGIQSGVNLGGAQLRLDLSGLTPGQAFTANLIEVDELIGTFDEVIFEGLDNTQDASVIVNYDTDTVQLNVGLTGQGSSGTDVIHGGGGANLIRGGDGADSLFGQDGADTLEGGEGSDLLDGGRGFDHIMGGIGEDIISAGASADRVYGGDGNDWISGGSNLGETQDGLWGEAGNDTIFGDGGFDFLDGGDGNDLLDGGGQADNLYGRDGNDVLRGGQGLDRLFGGTGDDLSHGGDDNDGLFGEAGNDTLYGEAGNDRFFGGSGNDRIFGGADNDTINGGSGFDTIDGGTGNDLLFGRFNADIFVFADGHGQDTIGDFAALNDFERIDLRDVSAISELNDLDLSSSTNGAATQSGSDVVIATGDSNWIVLSDTNLSDLDANDFIF